MSSIELTKGDYTRAERLFRKEKDIIVPLTEGKGFWSVALTSPMFVTAYYEDSLNNNGYSYLFYLSPGDNLVFSFDANNPDSTYKVIGRGSNHNQPILQKVINDELDLGAYKKDSLPYAVLGIIEKMAEKRRLIVNSYFAKNKPAGSFRKICSLYLRYYPVWTYLRFRGEQWFSARQTYQRNEKYWQEKEDSILAVNPLGNDLLLQLDEYAFFLSLYLTRIKERIWRQQEFLKEYYDTRTVEEAKKLHADDPENLLKERIVQKHFSGKTAEYLDAVLFRDAIKEKEDNLPEIYSRFIKNYPGSQYIPYLQPAIASIENRRKHKLTDQMVFVENSEAFQTFEDILKLVKGKTVLLDMWGTWCGPCRAEIIEHSDSIKQHFADKSLTYLYIANYDQEREKKWKELISYYKLTGMHILASQSLTKDIMEKVKGEGFPTNVIIKRDGSFELSKAGYPMKRELLIKQVEKALKE